jgi:hypothetical protein
MDGADTEKVYFLFNLDGKYFSVTVPAQLPQFIVMAPDK